MKWKKRKLLALLPIMEEHKKLSKDSSTKIAAYIIDEDYTIRSSGYNSFPRGIDDNKPERQERPEKYFWMEHSERNAIYNALRIGANVKDCWMIMTCGMPCTGCARGIIQVGLQGIILQARGVCVVSNKEKWNEEAIRSEQMLKEAEKQIVYLDELDEYII
jgi:dCMP deaminase